MNTIGSVPLWRRITDELRERISAGQYAREFPGELDIASEFSVSRGTARAALRPLREAGLISASRGRRPQIAQLEPGSQYGAIYSLRDLITTAGMRHHSAVLQQHFTTDTAAAARLGTPPGEILFHLERVRFADDRPVAFDEVFSPSSVAAPLIDVDFSDVPFYRELRARCAVTVHGGSEQIQAVSADERLAGLLTCDPGASLLLVERLACSSGQIVEYRRSYILGDRFRLARPFGTSVEGGPCSPG